MMTSNEELMASMQLELECELEWEMQMEVERSLRDFIMDEESDEEGDEEGEEESDNSWLCYQIRDMRYLLFEYLEVCSTPRSEEQAESLEDLESLLSQLEHRFHRYSQLDIQPVLYHLAREMTEEVLGEIAKNNLRELFLTLSLLFRGLKVGRKVKGIYERCWDQKKVLWNLIYTRE